jgi:hypothetical protein
MATPNVCKPGSSYVTMAHNNVSRFCGGYCPVDIESINNTNNKNWRLIYGGRAGPRPSILNLSGDGSIFIPYELIYFMNVEINPARGALSGNKCGTPCSYKMDGCSIKKTCNTSILPRESNIETCTNQLQFGINLITIMILIMEALSKIQSKLHKKGTKHFSKKELSVKISNPFTGTYFSLEDLQTFICTFRKGIELISYYHTPAYKITAYGTYAWGLSWINSLLSNPTKAGELLDTITILLCSIGAILDVASTKRTQGMLRLGGLATGRFKTASALECCSTFCGNDPTLPDLNALRNIKDITHILSDLNTGVDKSHFKQEGGNRITKEYNYIYEPITNKKVVVFSKKGQQILQNYILYN